MSSVQRSLHLYSINEKITVKMFDAQRIGNAKSIVFEINTFGPKTKDYVIKITQKELKNEILNTLKENVFSLNDSFPLKTSNDKFVIATVSDIELFTENNEQQKICFLIEESVFFFKSLFHRIEISFDWCIDVHRFVDLPLKHFVFTFLSSLKSIQKEKNHLKLPRYLLYLIIEMSLNN